MAAVESLEQLFADFEVRRKLARHRHLVAGARVAADPLATPAGGEDAEAAQLDPIARVRAEPICSNTVSTIRSMSRA